MIMTKFRSLGQRKKVTAKKAQTLKCKSISIIYIQLRTLHTLADTGRLQDMKLMKQNDNLLGPLVLSEQVRLDQLQTIVRTIHASQEADLQQPQPNFKPTSKSAIAVTADCNRTAVSTDLTYRMLHSNMYDLFDISLPQTGDRTRTNLQKAGYYNNME